jgi:hypothetical protein
MIWDDLDSTRVIYLVADPYRFFPVSGLSWVFHLSRLGTLCLVRICVRHHGAFLPVAVEISAIRFTYDSISVRAAFNLALKTLLTRLLRAHMESVNIVRTAFENCNRLSGARPHRRYKYHRSPELILVIVGRLLFATTVIRTSFLEFLDTGRQSRYFLLLS